DGTSPPEIDDLTLSDPENDGSYENTYAPTVSGTDLITAALNGSKVLQDNDGTSDGDFHEDVLTSSPPNIEASPNPNNFGSVVVSVLEGPDTIQISNSGDQDLDISSITLNDTTNYTLDKNPATNPCGDSITLTSGSNCNIEVSFSPTTTGVLDNSITVVSNDPDGDYDIDLQGEGINDKDINVDPETYDYGEVIEGESSSSQSFIIENAGNADLTISDIVLNDTTNYTLDTDTCGTSTVLTSSQTCTINVTFNPSATGVFDTSVTITSDDPDENPFDITLTGEGVSAITPEPNISVLPSSLNFTDQGQTKQVTVKNIGTATLNITSISLSNSDFVLNKDDCGSGTISLNQNESCALTVTFNQSEEGSYSAEITINSNDLDTPDKQVPLTANKAMACDYFDFIDDDDREESEDNLVEDCKEDDCIAFELCLSNNDERSSDKVDKDKNGETAIEKIKLKAEKDILGEFIVTKHENAPSKLEIEEKYEGENYLVYKYLKIESEDFENDEVDKATLYFIIENDWIEENSIVEMYFFQSKEDKPQEADLKEIDKNYSYYKVKSDRLTPYWTIIGRKEDYPDIETSEEEYNFGLIGFNEGMKTRDLTITNVGEGDLQISGMHIENNESFGLELLTCQSNQILEQDQSCTVQVIFNPNVLSELRTKLIINSNDPDEPEKEVFYLGRREEEKKPEIDLSVREHEFEPIVIREGEEVPDEILFQPVKVYNKGNADLNISDIKLTESDQYIIDLNPADADNPCQEKNVLRPGETCDIEIGFRPKEEGSESVTLEVESNDPNEPVAKALFRGATQRLAKEAEVEEVAPVTQIEQFSEPKEVMPSKFWDFLLPVLNLLALLFYNRRKKRAGVVFDIASGKPLKESTVELFDKDGKIKDSITTDKTGNYFFLVNAGSYTLDVKKEGYHLVDKKEAKPFAVQYDPQYYEGQTISFKKEDNLAIGIPMRKDMAKSSEVVFSKSGLLRLLDTIFILGFISAVVIVIINPVIYNIVIVILYVIFILIRIILPKKPKWGLVRDEKKRPRPLTYVNVFDQNGAPVARTITDAMGRYAILLAKGKYNLKVKASDGASVTKSIKLGREKIVTKNITLRSKDKKKTAKDNQGGSPSDISEPKKKKETKEIFGIEV
ncbi:MAG: choice-of-anchor D domain-containing protein, partial [Candidatus Moranbacteria bacterium]|nr:choice-of-anchor D domain-containing protein [Candidatus Moranbacteria bacterium]